MKTILSLFFVFVAGDCAAQFNSAITITSTATFSGNAFSVGGSTLVVAGGAVGVDTASVSSGQMFQVGGSSLAVRTDGTVLLSLFTKAVINGITPVAGAMAICTNCTHPYTLCVATGTAKGQWRESGLTTGCN